MFKKRQTRNFRKKHGDEEDDNGDNQSDNESRGSNGSLSKETKKSGNEIIPGITKSNPSTSSLLSFGDDEDEEVFQVRKSAASRNLERARRRLHTAKITVQEEQEESTDFKESSKATSSHRRDEIIVKETGKFLKKVESSPERSTILSGRDAENVDDEEEEEAEEPILGKFKQVLTSGAIPDANLIHMARKQRQLAREMGTGETPGNFVPIRKTDDTQKYKIEKKGRLVREEDENENSDSGEEGGRFYSKLHDEEEEARRQVEAEFLRVEQGDSDEDKDDELDRWEREQIRKGVSRNQVNYFGQDYVASAMGDSFGRYQKTTHSTLAFAKEVKEPQPMEIDMDLTGDEDEGSDIKKEFNSQRPSASSRIGGGVQNAAEQILFKDVRAKLEQRHNEQQAMYQTRLLDREKVRDFLAENETTTSKLVEAVPRLSEQYRFYQEMRTYVRDLLDCFNEKMPLIESAETKLMELWTGRADFLIKRRQQDVKDQYDDCSAASFGKMQMLQQNSERIMRAAEREARRTRRRQGREKTLASLGHHEGVSSDDEEAPSRIVNFNSEKEKLCAETTEIFKDTVDEFCSVEEITNRFMEWRKLYKDSFDQAYIIYCLPKLLAPLIRWRTLAWNLLEADAQPLKSMDWYISLEKLEKSQRETFDEDDFELVFAVLDATLLTRIKAMVEHVWDPTSSSQTSNLAAFVAGLARDHPKSSEKGKNATALKDAIRERIKRSLDDDLFTPIYSKELIENKSTGASQFSDRQFWFSIKVIQNLSVWTSVFSDQVVQEFVFDGVVNRHVVLALQCGGAADNATLTKCKAVCGALPSSWFAGLKDGESLPQSEPLCKLLVRIADEFNGNKTMDKSNIRDATKEIYRLLMKLRGWKHAETLSQKYRVK